MAEEQNTFVINDRRKFNKDGELREPLASAPVEPQTATPAPEPEPTPAAVSEPTAAAPVASEAPAEAEGQEYPDPTPEELAEVQAAYNATAERLELAMRSSNLGGEFLPAMDFSRLVQSIYMTAMVQLGVGTQPGEKARVDLLGARQSIDMLRVLLDKSTNNLTPEETRLITNAVFELQMSFLQMTQALAQSAAARMQQGGESPAGVPPAGPKLVR